MEIDCSYAVILTFVTVDKLLTWSFIKLSFQIKLRLEWKIISVKKDNFTVPGSTNNELIGDFDCFNDRGLFLGFFLS